MFDDQIYEDIIEEILTLYKTIFDQIYEDSNLFKKLKDIVNKDESKAKLLTGLLYKSAVNISNFSKLDDTKITIN